MQPLWKRLEHPIDVPDLLRRLAHLPHCLLLDSALAHSQLGRYSFLAVDPVSFHTFSGDAPPCVAELRGLLRSFSSDHVAELPPFQGGLAGLFCYDFARAFERIPSPRHDEFGVPVVAVGLYDLVIAIDHQRDAVFLVSQGFPEQDPAARRERAADRLAWLEHQLSQQRATSATRESTALAVSREQLFEQHRVKQHDLLTSNMSPQEYRQRVARAVEYIHAGDIFQVNLAQRLLHPANDTALNFYLRLRERNPATFAGYFDIGDFQILSASPERFLRVHQGQVETRPIKGTRSRSRTPEADLFAASDLLASEKDRAENVMIVDLLRNDLSRVCTNDSVQVTQLCNIEKYEFVQHLVSAVEGTLRPECDNLDLLAAAFPGGSITGAPKVRAMEIIAELEPTARGPYCGSLGYFGFDGSVDLSILIRTVTAGRGWWQLPVGGGIVADSTPQSEWEETWHKAEGLLRALQ